jgi:hypothetical protein
MAEVVVVISIMRIVCVCLVIVISEIKYYSFSLTSFSSILPFSFVYLITIVIHCRVDGHMMDLNWSREIMSIEESFRSTGFRSPINAQFNSLLEHGLEIAP